MKLKILKKSWKNIGALKTSSCTMCEKKKINMMYLSLFRYTTQKSIWMNV